MSALATILLISSFSTFIYMVLTKELFNRKIFFLKWLTKQKLQIFFDYNGNESWRGGYKQNFGKSWHYWVNSEALSKVTKRGRFILKKQIGLRFLATTAPAYNFHKLTNSPRKWIWKCLRGRSNFHAFFENKHSTVRGKRNVFFSWCKWLQRHLIFLWSTIHFVEDKRLL